ncbi:error-prone DNA polymerase [Altererythrobacter sp. CC-YST694]|uniref:error-prone DNA polymerase n=1 Tax=Altererythrobacter sp. CC-YST694 TaxID=2755038 RepID=UPI001D009FA6|nr:error-prone DNA polymerase [Altererythrobacter sp. CC-YST694]MCB5426343.1 error-prone DNA polymerase [Altererythrobacter sp. CC-YST694]
MNAQPEPPFAELIAATNYSFLRGASHPADMVTKAIALGHKGIGIADRNTVAGVVRAYAALRDFRAELGPEALAAFDFRLVVGARLVFTDDTPDIVAYPMNRAGWGRLTRLLTLGNRRAGKGDCTLYFADLIEHADHLLLIAIADETHELLLRRLAARTPLWIAVTMARQGDDQRRLARLQGLSARTGIPLLATCDVLYATPEQRPLHDVITCIREGVTLAQAGTRLLANAERHLKSPAEMARLFKGAPQAVAASAEILSRIGFTLDELRYEYPHEPVPKGWKPMPWLKHITMQAAEKKYPEGIPRKIRNTLRTEFRLIRKRRYAYYFLTVYELVKFARSLDPPILCQGRGSAANSAVCYFLGITSVDPGKFNLLFSRFVSAERNEPPDIDVDFEHERREEVIQHIYEHYGRSRAGIAATVIHYRPKSAVREVGKVLGLSEDITARLTSTVWGSYAGSMEAQRIANAGFDPNAPELARLHWIVEQLLNAPRHLSQHVGGFVLTQGRLDELVPIHNAAMEDRTFIEWDKDDIDTLGLMKVDVLALGMLSCIRKAFKMMREHGLGDLTLATVPQEEEPVYDMLCKGDSIGVFQVESRAQINMLPRLKPRKFYDLAVQVAIVRPGPIEGDMVHPYLKRRSNKEAVEFPSPAPPHDPNELHDVLGDTFGVPLFQEQAMKLAITAAGFTPDEANQLRRAMATFRNVGTIDNFEPKMIGGMVARGYQRDFAQRCYNQIRGFGSYGFPESHAISFALLVYVSAWLKCRHPAVFAAALLNSQPMGFYAPAQIVRDAREHGVDVRAVDLNHSEWNNSLETGATDGAVHERWDWDVAASRLDKGHALRLGFRQIDGFREDWGDAIVAERRANGPFASIEELARRVRVSQGEEGDKGAGERHSRLPARALRLLADADACRSIGLERRPAAWEVRRMPGGGELPLFAAARARELAPEPDSSLSAMPLSEEVAADYQTTRLSLKQHPMHFLRETLRGEGILSSEELLAVPDGRRAKVAGVVLVRQRPGKGNAIFATLEDETGVVNILLWARMFERYRRLLMASRLMEVHGQVQKSEEGVLHLMADRIVDRTELLNRLGEQDTASAGIPSPSEQSQARHPRNVRIIPKSRDFH